MSTQLNIVNKIVTLQKQLLAMYEAHVGDIEYKDSLLAEKSQYTESDDLAICDKNIQSVEEIILNRINVMRDISQNIRTLESFILK